jgi:hypothetical protein
VRDGYRFAPPILRAGVADNSNAPRRIIAVTHPSAGEGGVFAAAFEHVAGIVDGLVGDG